MVLESRRASVLAAWAHGSALPPLPPLGGAWPLGSQLRRRGAEPREAPPAWAAELLESAARSARAAARVATRIEALDEKLATGLTELRSEVLALRPPRRAEQPANESLEDLLDALDALDEAVRLLDRDRPEAATGLRGVARRIERFRPDAACGASRARRADRRRLFRVVGTEPSSTVPRGRATRVVRAAATGAEGTLREGEVIASAGGGEAPAPRAEEGPRTNEQQREG
jgi:hypothetical protein